MNPEEAKEAIKEILNDSDQDSYIDFIIESVVDYIESETKEDIARHGL